MRWMLIPVLLLSLGCTTMTTDKCKGYATLAKLIALQLAEDISPAENRELRDRWAEVGELAAQAGCEQWTRPSEET